LSIFHLIIERHKSFGRFFVNERPFDNVTANFIVGRGITSCRKI